MSGLAILFFGALFAFGDENIVLLEGFVSTEERTIEIVQLPLEHIKKTTPLACTEPQRILSVAVIGTIAKKHIDSLIGVLAPIGETWIQSQTSNEGRAFLAEHPEVAFDIGRTSWKLVEVVARPVEATRLGGTTLPNSSDVEGRFYYEVRFFGFDKNRKQPIGPVSVFVFQDGTLLPVRKAKATDEAISKALHFRAEAENSVR